MRAVCKAYGVEKGVLGAKRSGRANEPRKMALYLLRTLRGKKLEEIGKQVNMANYSSVSSVIERMKARIEGDRNLRRRVEEIKGQLLMSQERA